MIWHNAIATKDNMKQRKRVGDFTCSFCEEFETINHLLLFFPLAQLLLTCGVRYVVLLGFMIDPSASLNNLLGWVLTFMLFGRLVVSCSVLSQFAVDCVLYELCV
jgi:hypothetical protein